MPFYLRIPLYCSIPSKYKLPLPQNSSLHSIKVKHDLPNPIQSQKRSTQFTLTNDDVVC